jgi:hypothetical protein
MLSDENKYEIRGSHGSEGVEESMFVNCYLEGQQKRKSSSTLCFLFKGW